ncbi:MAG TPA: hypothetical protein VII62_02490 [Vicinamibacteria bacterium]
MISEYSAPAAENPSATNLPSGEGAILDGGDVALLGSLRLERRRIEQELLGAPPPVAVVELAHVLAAESLLVEDAAAFERDGVVLRGLKPVELQPLLGERVARADLRELVVREGGLRLEPALDGLILQVLQPAIGILVGNAEVGVTDVDGSRRRVLDLGERRAGDRDCADQREQLHGFLRKGLSVE